MGKYADYFASERPKPKYLIGDRVTGKFKGIPFCGTVGNDNMISLEQGPMVSIHSDLPIMTEEKIYTIFKVKYKDIKRLV